MQNPISSPTWGIPMTFTRAARAHRSAPVGLNEFLQPHSMMTPGALGALAMVGTNAITLRFHGMDPSYVVAALSLLFGLAAAIKEGSLPTRVLFYVLNSIIVFSVAAGTNTVGQATQIAGIATIAPAYAAGTPSQSGTFFKPWFNVPQSAPDSDKPVWYVIVGSYADQNAAQQAAASINTQFPGKYDARAVKSSAGDAWVVRVGKDGTLSDAADVKAKADADNLSRDSLIQKKVGAN
jgi:hypothetical protein